MGSLMDKRSQATKLQILSKTLLPMELKALMDGSLDIVTTPQTVEATIMIQRMTSLLLMKTANGEAMAGE